MDGGDGFLLHHVNLSMSTKEGDAMDHVPGTGLCHARLLECMTYLEERADGMGGETKEGRGREGRSPNLVYGSPGEYRGTTVFISVCEAKGGKEPYCVCTWVHSRYVLPSTYLSMNVRDQNRSVRSEEGLQSQPSKVPLALETYKKDSIHFTQV